ncbi:MAG: hypothetical protein RLY35_1569 [Bacteroidota bacterium]|jgi:type IX secretion system PorP/SprF family membrane protein
MNKMRKTILSFLLIAVSLLGFAQDQQFTQFYAVPTAMNPAFAGANLQSRFAMQYRNQWLGIPKGYRSYVASYDSYINSIKSGVGVIVQREDAGAGNLSRTQFGIQYAYETRIKRNWYMRPALQFSLGSRSLNFNNLTFYDQLIRNNAPTSLETYPAQSKQYFDAGAGLLVYGPDLWVGLSAMHLNTPNEAVFETNSSLIPTRYAVHAGKRFRIKGYSLKRLDHHLFVAANYMSQGKFDQLDLGFSYEIKPLFFGVWYRGLPVKSNGYDLPNRDAIAFLFGFTSGPFNIGYSYDVTTSRLGVGNSAGAHELTLAYNMAVKIKTKRKIIPCAAF